MRFYLIPLAAMAIPLIANPYTQFMVNLMLVYVLVAPITLLHPGLGASFLIKGFAAMTLGGFGSFGGAVAGGLLLGLAEQLVGGYVSTKLIDITAYLVIILVLALRPNGLFGRAIAEKV